MKGFQPVDNLVFALLNILAILLVRMSSKAEIRAQLQREILALQGFRPAPSGAMDELGLGRINRAFPHGRFPMGALHEFLCAGPEEAAASAGFLSGLLGTIMQKGPVVWVAPRPCVFPPALKQYGVDPERVLFVEGAKDREALWIVEEALKCKSVSAVVGEIRELDFTASRRMQLAMEQSGVTAFLLRRQPRNMATAFVARWQVRSLPSLVEEGLPGVGFPRWEVELLKVRNGQPGRWELEWVEGSFRHATRLAALTGLHTRKTG